MIPPFHLTCVETLHGVGLGDVLVLGEANITVSLNNCEVEVDFLIADIVGHEVLLGHPVFTQAGARLDFGKARIVLFRDEVPYFHPETAQKSQTVRVA